MRVNPTRVFDTFKKDIFTTHLLKLINLEFRQTFSVKYEKRIEVSRTKFTPNVMVIFKA